MAFKCVNILILLIIGVHTIVETPTLGMSKMQGLVVKNGLGTSVLLQQ